MALTPSRKKPTHPLSPGLRHYLRAYERTAALPLTYDDLAHFESSVPLVDARGEDTLWQTVYYRESERAEVNLALRHVYAVLKTDGDDAVIEHLEVARVDFCSFGNTQPFRVRVRNRINDNYDHYYVKRADANRVYGLELEHLLSPNRITYLVDGDTLVEEHIAGVPGDDFQAGGYLDVSDIDQTRIAKEFVKFNERCFARLLGDMRAYNYVVDITPDIEGNQYRLRAIDFDQQSYEGALKFYLPQYFKDNNGIIALGMRHMTPESVAQYQQEERTLIAARARASRDRLGELLDGMAAERLSTPGKVSALAAELGAQLGDASAYRACASMGQLVATQLRTLTERPL